MTIAHMRQMFDYNYWRNHKILAKAVLIQPWQFVAPTTFPWINLHATLAHTLGVEQLFLLRLKDGISPTAVAPKDEVPTLHAIVERWAEVERGWRRWLNTLTDASLDEIKTYNMLNGKTVYDPLWQCLLHVVNHGTQHCAEMAQMLTDYGQSPGNIDLVYYMRETKN